MLSKKMTVSLTSLITIFALAFAVPSVMAVDFEVTIEGARVVTYTTTTASTPITLDLLVTSEEALPEPLVFTDADAATPVVGHISVEVRDDRGFISGISDSRVTVTDDDASAFTGRTVKQRQLSVSIMPQTGTGPIIDQVKITIPAFETPDTRVDPLHDMSITVEHTILVREADDVNYDVDDANVVSIQRLRPGSQAAVAAFQDEEIKPDPFDIRVVLTEMRFDRVALADETPEHRDKLAKDLVDVGGGKASNLRVGIPFARAFVGRAVADPAAETDTTIKPHPNEGRYSSFIGTTNAPPWIATYCSCPGTHGS